MTRHLRLTIKVTYDLNGEPIDEVKELLAEAAQHLAEEGLVDGETSAIIDEWCYTVEDVTAR